MSVEFIDNSIKVKGEVADICEKWLLESATAIESQTKNNTAVDTGQLKGSWTHQVNYGEKTATVGSPLENAIWEEVGTGEYALNGKGRKGGWVYVDAKGQGHFTHGKKPRRALFKAFTAKKTSCQRRLAQMLKEVGR